MFLLFMETHMPYQHSPGFIVDDLVVQGYRPVTNQITAMENIDREMGRLIKHLNGTNTDMIVTSDHGELDLKWDGQYGHSFEGKFHPKLFEIPYGRFTV